MLTSFVWVLPPCPRLWPSVPAERQRSSSGQRLRSCALPPERVCHSLYQVRSELRLCVRSDLRSLLSAHATARQSLQLLSTSSVPPRRWIVTGLDRDRI